jgi:hypothetical protein
MFRLNPGLIDEFLSRTIATQQTHQRIVEW